MSGCGICGTTKCPVSAGRTSEASAHLLMDDQMLELGLDALELALSSRKDSVRSSMLRQSALDLGLMFYDGKRQQATPACCVNADDDTRRAVLQAQKGAE